MVYNGHQDKDFSYLLINSENNMSTKREKVGQDPIKHAEAAKRANAKRASRVKAQAAKKRANDEMMARIMEDAYNMHKIWLEEQEMHNEAPKKPKSAKSGMKVRVGLEEYPSLNAALRACDPIKWGEETPFRRSCWTRINRNLKKFGDFQEAGFIFELI